MQQTDSAFNQLKDEEASTSHVPKLLINHITVLQVQFMSFSRQYLL
jgi:hypothetical protein